MATNYSLSCHNKSNILGTFMVFQQDPNIGVQGVYSLAWFVKTAHPDTDVEFDWTIDYSMLWCETGELRPGVKFVASQKIKADPAGTDGPNKTSLTYEQNSYVFKDQSSSGSKGSLTIDCDDTLPPGKASTGIGMSGAGTFVVQANPLVTNVFTPHPTYWIAFGNFVKGTVLDIQSLSRPKQLQFTDNIYHLDVTYNANGTWTVNDLLSHNTMMLKEARRLEARRGIGDVEPMGPCDRVYVVDPLTGDTLLRNGTGAMGYPGQGFAARWFQQDDLPVVGKIYKITGQYVETKQDFTEVERCTRVYRGAEGYIALFG